LLAAGNGDRGIFRAGGNGVWPVPPGWHERICVGFLPASRSDAPRTDLI